MSLSPRPERFRITIASRGIFGARAINSASACADSSAGMMPSMRASVRAAATRRVIAHGRVLGAMPVGEPRVLGTDRRIIEARRNRMRGRNLAVGRLQHVGVGALQHAGPRAANIRPPRPCARRARQASCRGLPLRRPAFSRSASSRNAWNKPIALEPPPTHATSRSGKRFSASRICARASSPITR